MRQQCCSFEPAGARRPAGRAPMAKGWGRQKSLQSWKGSDGQILPTSRKLMCAVIPGEPGRPVGWPRRRPGHAVPGLHHGGTRLRAPAGQGGADLDRHRGPAGPNRAGRLQRLVAGIQDPALNQLIDTAYRENLTLRIAGVRVLEARAQLGIVTGQLYPQSQQATGSLQKVRISPSEVLGGSAQGASSFVMSLACARPVLTASWELDFWGKFRRAIQSADASLQATIADYDNVLVSLTADVASNYILMRTLESDWPSPTKTCASRPKACKSPRRGF